MQSSIEGFSNGGQTTRDANTATGEDPRGRERASWARQRACGERPMKGVLLPTWTGGHGLTEPAGRQDRPVRATCCRELHRGTLAS